MTFEQEQGPKYAEELDKIVNMLQIVHPVGRTNGIDRLEASESLACVLHEYCRMSEKLNMIDLDIQVAMHKLSMAKKRISPDSKDVDDLQSILLRME